MLLTASRSLKANPYAWLYACGLVQIAVALTYPWLISEASGLGSAPAAVRPAFDYLDSLFQKEEFSTVQLVCGLCGPLLSLFAGWKLVCKRPSRHEPQLALPLTPYISVVDTAPASITSETATMNQHPLRVSEKFLKRRARLTVPASASSGSDHQPDSG